MSEVTDYQLNLASRIADKLKTNYADNNGMTPAKLVIARVLAESDIDTRIADLSAEAERAKADAVKAERETILNMIKNHADYGCGILYQLEDAIFKRNTESGDSQREGV